MRHECPGITCLSNNELRYVKAMAIWDLLEASGHNMGVGIDIWQRL